MEAYGKKRLRGAVALLVAATGWLLAGCAVPLVAEADRRGGDAVTRWTLIGDYYGNGAANWRTLAIMQAAMHDALNAVQPVYRRWASPRASEPSAAGADPEVAMAAAAEEVLILLHPDRQAETEASFASVAARYPDGASKEAATRLGRAIGRAAIESREHDGFEQVHPFQGHEGPGRWERTPTTFATSPTTDSRPFLFAAVADVPTTPPPTLDSPTFQQQLAETRSLGGVRSTERAAQQTNDAYFWAYQSSQRGFVDLAVRLFAAHRPPGGVHAEARILAQLALALADSAILTWSEKEQYGFWRPVTAIRAEGGDPGWLPLIETPPFPEYPSGHATDCFVGAGLLEAAFPGLPGPIEYRSSAHVLSLGEQVVVATPGDFGMGQHAQRGAAETPGGKSRFFMSLADAATNCAMSRIWAGAHFRAAAIESERLGQLIVGQALDRMQREASVRGGI